ncbi:MAG: translesion DNA synthesis-associated protein ImuA [Gammaproteobacteria bacterium]|nr:translesion DNA synthesis-associated protein ImuA [Gammaproteobacteria bacterium]
MKPALEELVKSHPSVWLGRDQYNDLTSIPSGFTSLDQALPSSGWAMGTVTELLISQQGIGEFSLLLPALKHVTENDQWAVLIKPPYIPYAPALTNAGINLERLLIIDSDSDTDTLWATEQVLRCGLFSAVVSWVSRSDAKKQRRLQLAAETGRTWAAVYRPAHAHKEHSPSALRITLALNDEHLQLDIIKSRGGTPQTVLVNLNEFDHSQGSVWPGIKDCTDYHASRLATLSSLPATR